MNGCTEEALYYAPLYNGQSAVTDKQQQKTRSVTFFNSVIKTPLLRTLLMDIRQLRTLFLVPIEEKTLYYGHQVRISLYFREKTSFSDKVARLFCHDE